jgi:dihydropteroate synthase
MMLKKIPEPLIIPRPLELGLRKLRTPGRLSLDRAYIVGVLNVTADSFSDGNKFLRVSASIPRALDMLEHGADIIDIGGESTRPGAHPLPLESELKRVLPVIENLVRIRPDIIISIDTYKAKVAEAAIRAGARIINDISGLGFDPAMAAVAARYQAPLILMHINGTPRMMQANPRYRELKRDIFGYFRKRINYAVRNGVKRSQIIVDPGLGFGKIWQDNYKILGWLDDLHGLGQPIMIGPSRKSFIGRVLHLPPEERVEGTAAVAAYAVFKGVQFIRVHDVREIKRVVLISEMIKQYGR